MTPVLESMVWISMLCWVDQVICHQLLHEGVEMMKLTSTTVEKPCLVLVPVSCTHLDDLFIYVYILDFRLLSTQ